MEEETGDGWRFAGVPAIQVSARSLSELFGDSVLFSCSFLVVFFTHYVLSQYYIAPAPDNVGPSRATDYLAIFWRNGLCF